MAGPCQGCRGSRRRVVPEPASLRIVVAHDRQPATFGDLLLGLLGWGAILALAVSIMREPD